MSLPWPLDVAARAALRAWLKHAPNQSAVADACDVSTNTIAKARAGRPLRADVRAKILLALLKRRARGLG